MIKDQQKNYRFFLLKMADCVSRGGSRRGRGPGFGRAGWLVVRNGGYGDVGQAGGYGLPFFAGSEVGVEDGLDLGFHSESGEGLSASDGVGEEEAYLNRGRLMLWLCFFRLIGRIGS